MPWRSDFLTTIAPHILWTVLIVGASYLVGLAVNSWVVRRLARLATITSGQGDDIVIGEIRRRLPWWSVLAGLWISISRLPLDPTIDVMLGRVVFTLATLSVTMAVSSIATGLVTSYGRSVTPPLAVTALSRSIISLLIIGLGLLVVLNGLGVSITPMLTALGVGGLAVALALQEPLSNLFAGVFVTLAGQIHVGDYVKLDGGLEGHVQDFGWRTARIRQTSNNVVLVPNSKLAQAVLINYSLPDAELAVTIDVTVVHGSDLERVERVTNAVAAEVMRDVVGGVPDFAPLVRFHTFAEAGIVFTAIMRGRDVLDVGLIKHEFVKRLQARYRDEGIMIPSTLRAVAMPPAVS